MTKEIITIDQEEAAQEIVEVGPVKLFLSSYSQGTAGSVLQPCLIPQCPHHHQSCNHTGHDYNQPVQHQVHRATHPLSYPPLHQGDAAHARQQPGVVEGSSQLGQENSVPAKSDSEAAEIGSVSPVSVVSF